MRLSGLSAWFLTASQFPVSAIATAGSKVVNLKGYGKFTGTVINSTYTGYSLPEPVDAWLGIDYATQPIGERRFKPIDWPAPFKGTKEATAYGNSCIQNPSSVSIESQSEACLSFNVYRSQGPRLNKKLPVLVWIHGGSFNTGSWRSFDGAAFAAASKEPIVVVTFHYRLNSLGFLPSELFEQEGLLNLGILDQQFFLKKFVQRYIASFGGDPDEVTLGGRSAGAHSVGIHYFHNYAQDAGKPYFARAIHQSGSVTARTFPNATYPLYVQQFETLMNYVGCPTGDNAAAISCLRTADIDEIRNISTKLYSESESNLTWPFQPTQGGPLLEKFGSQSGYDRTFFHVPVISSTVTDEAKLYIGDEVETSQQFLDYFHNISPTLTDDDLDLLNALYPDPSADPESPYANSPNSTQYNRLAAAVSDYAYICPGQETAYRASTAGVPTWKLRFNTNNSFPAWQGIAHTADTRYTWNDPTIQHPDIGIIYSGYLTSFVATGNPNTLRYPGAPKWPNYKPSGYGIDSTPARQLVVQANNQTQVELDDIRREACLYWRDPERAPRLNK